MELLTLPQLAEAASMPLSTTRYYRDRFILFVPTVRVGRTLLHPEEAVEVLRTVDELAARGSTVSEIENALERAFPVTVVTSQGVASDTTIEGPAGVIGELANMLDDRGSRVESEVAAIREQIASSATANQLEGLIFETRLAAHAIGERFGAEMIEMKQNVEELRSQVGLLASRDQLEWIGDVVSAAITRSPGAGPSGMVEKKLLEIQEELGRPRPSDDVGELRVAIDRLAEHVSNRDKEFQRTLHALVNVMRTEVRTLQSELKDVLAERKSDSAQSQVETSKVDAPVVLIAGEKSAPESRDEQSADAGKSRAPRRLGHSNRSSEAASYDFKAIAGIEEAS